MSCTHAGYSYILYNVYTSIFMERSVPLADLLIYVILGLSIGVMSGFFGIGGGFILTPTLILLGFSPVTAIATSLLYTVATTLSGVTAHLRLNHIKWKTSIIIGISGIISTQLAHPFVIFLEKYQLENTIIRSEEHTSELQSREKLVCRLLLEKKKQKKNI